MNKEQRKFLKKCKQSDIFEELPLLKGIYIIPTRHKHDSGYQIMDVVGDGIDGKKYLVDNISDVVDFDDWFSNVKISDLHIDMTMGGIIHIWSNRQYMKNDCRVSNCTFTMVDRRLV